MVVSKWRWNSKRKARIDEVASTVVEEVSVQTFIIFMTNRDHNCYKIRGFVCLFVCLFVGRDLATSDRPSIATYDPIF